MPCDCDVPGSMALIQLTDPNKTDNHSLFFEAPRQIRRGDPLPPSSTSRLAPSSPGFPLRPAMNARRPPRLVNFWPSGCATSCCHGISPSSGSMVRFASPRGAMPDNRQECLRQPSSFAEYGACERFLVNAVKGFLPRVLRQGAMRLDGADCLRNPRLLSASPSTALDCGYLRML